MTEYFALMYPLFFVCSLPRSLTWCRRRAAHHAGGGVRPPLRGRGARAGVVSGAAAATKRSRAGKAAASSPRWGGDWRGEEGSRCCEEKGRRKESGARVGGALGASGSRGDQGVDPGRLSRRARGDVLRRPHHCVRRCGGGRRSGPCCCGGSGASLCASFLLFEVIYCIYCTRRMTENPYY